MKTNLNDLKASGQIGKKKSRIKRESELKEKTERGLANLRELQKQYYGDPYMCRILFLAHIDEKVLDEFFNKVRSLISKDQYITLPKASDHIERNKYWAKSTSKTYLCQQASDILKEKKKRV